MSGAFDPQYAPQEPMFCMWPLGHRNRPHRPRRHPRRHSRTGHTMTVTITDLFCGAGGSSLGAEAVGGRLVMAANHWQTAIDVHQAAA